jgi:hypothetical protein
MAVMVSICGNVFVSVSSNGAMLVMLPVESIHMDKPYDLVFNKLLYELTHSIWEKRWKLSILIVLMILS